jgi:polyisoprenyl-phosphate glycosyltransferase
MVTQTPVDISVLIPCLDEAENVDAIANAVRVEMAKADVSYEVVFIDNGSTDGTPDLIKSLCTKDSRVRLIVNNKNYGQMRSPTYGIYQTTGAAVIGLSADFQDPPELIGELIARWRRGAKIVLGVRQSEKTSLLLRSIRAIGYGFFKRFGDYPVIPGATGFGLYDREVVDCLKRWRDPEPFFRGMLVESGFSVETIPYHRPLRAGGVTKNSLRSLFSFALSGLANSSKKLLRWPIYLSLLVFAATALTAAAAVVMVVLGQSALTLWLLAAAELGFGLVFLFIGIIGEQVRLISEMCRNVPLVVEKERVNFP